MSDRTANIDDTPVSTLPIPSVNPSNDSMLHTDNTGGDIQYNNQNQLINHDINQTQQSYTAGDSIKHYHSYPQLLYQHSTHQPPPSRYYEPSTYSASHTHTTSYTAGTYNTQYTPSQYPHNIYAQQLPTQLIPTQYHARTTHQYNKQYTQNHVMHTNAAHDSTHSIILPATYQLSNYSRILKVSGKSHVKNTAGSIAHTARSGDCPILICTGAMSINQSIKAICIARKYVCENDIDLYVRSEFRDEIKQQFSLILYNQSTNILPINTANSTSNSNILKQRHTSQPSTASSSSSVTSNILHQQSPDKHSIDSNIVITDLHDTVHSDDVSLNTLQLQLPQQPSVPQPSYELRVANQSEPSLTAGSIAKKIRNGESVNIVSIGAGSVSGSVNAITIAQRYLLNDNVQLLFQPEFIHVNLNNTQCSAIRFNIIKQNM